MSLIAMYIYCKVYIINQSEIMIWVILRQLGYTTRKWFLAIDKIGCYFIIFGR